MKARLKQLIERIDRLSLRERALVLLAILAIVYAGWYEVLMAPLSASQEQLAKKRDTLQTEIQALNTQVEQLAKVHSEDPNAPLRRQAETLRGEIDRLDERLAALTVNLIGAQQMASVLEQALHRQEDLTLLRVESLGAKPLAVERGKGDGEAGDAPAGAARPIYRHGLMLRFEGTYEATQAYLQALESLSWRFYWDSIDYEVGDYPNATITLRVHTLSLEEGWIGV